MFTSKRENNARKILELGSLPPQVELKKFTGKSASTLEKALDSINNKLKKYSHVNKKAFDQFVNFNETRVRLLKRKEELDHGAEKVKDLIESLDQKKDEAINRTFRGVSSHFKDVFKELVPDAAPATDEEEESSEDGSEESPKKKKGKDNANPDVSLYRGVGIKVRFSEIGEDFMMSQLSGGQKALVALGLIFAIQRTFFIASRVSRIISLCKREPHCFVCCFPFQAAIRHLSTFSTSLIRHLTRRIVQP